jgi:hypothetical protein
LQAWSNPDASQPAAANLTGNLDVQLLRWWGEWAEIRCSNGWTAWVGGRQLVPMGGPQGSSVSQLQGRIKDLPLPAGVSPLAAGGAALILLGSFLSWFDFGPVSQSSWDVPLLFPLTGDDTLDGFKMGLALLVIAVGVVGVPFLTKRPLEMPLIIGAAALTVALALGFFLRMQGDQFQGADVGFGTYITLAGGVLLGVAAYQANAGVGARGGGA